MTDILIQNGTIADGTGAPSVRSDLLVSGDKIRRVAPRISAPGAVVIDATGKLIAPGFINMHSHADCSVVMYPDMESTLGQGITTEFAGHCGLSAAPADRYWLYTFPEKRAFARVDPEALDDTNPYETKVIPTEVFRKPFHEVYGEQLDWSTYGEYLAHLRRTGIGANLAPVVGHGSIRLQAMGTEFRREATQTEIRNMEEYLLEALMSGAFGLSFGLDYAPGMYASREELLRLMKLVAAKGGLVTAHTRSAAHPACKRKKPRSEAEGLLEFLELGKESGARLHISHIRSACPGTPTDDASARDAVMRTLRLLERFRREGVSVTWDVIPKYAFGPFHYPMVASLFQPYVRDCGGCKAFSEKLLEDDGYAQGIAREIKAGKRPSRGIFTSFHPNDNPGWDTQYRFTRTMRGAWTGKTPREAAGGQDSVDFLLDLLKQDPYAAMISLKLRPEHTPERDCFAEQPDATIGLDTWSLNYDAVFSEGDMPLECGSPATYTGFPVFLETMRNRPIEQTIQKLTSNAATALGLTDRGFVKEGMIADLLVIARDAFSARENLADPRHGPQGLDYVIVGGKVAVDHGIRTHVRNGVILRRCA
ncbi:MAG: amidohydrolase family protein [Clostridiales Family XIII bacterium]|jgi:N-acyl-D-aspartate/D-glutamate deacylase|nr:amidohydrolase family protein [Clostridiales Family XIII bacterium]